MLLVLVDGLLILFGQDILIMVDVGSWCQGFNNTIQHQNNISNNNSNEKSNQNKKKSKVPENGRWEDSQESQPWEVPG